MTYINALGTAVPQYAYTQADLLKFMSEKIPMHPLKLEKLAQFYARSGISTRHSVLPDFGSESRQLFAQENASLSERMTIYEQEIVPLALKAIQDCFAGQTPGSEAFNKSDVTHLIAVTCTGMSAPGLDLMLMRELQLASNLSRTCVHYMGCYAALHALKQAHAIVGSDPEAVVLVVCAELCTLHFQQEESLDSLASSLLFADGAAATLLSAKPTGTGLKIFDFYSEVLLDGWQEMAWNLSESGFIMRLGSGVPLMLQAGMAQLVQKALQKYQWDGVDHWAIHPGGRKILDVSEESLGLSDQMLWASRQVLNDFGNMSSPTVLFVLQALLKRLHELPQESVTKVFSAAFGPGLTMESMGLLYAA